MDSSSEWLYSGNQAIVKLKTSLCKLLHKGPQDVETLKVKVRYFTTLRELAGKPEEEWEIEDSRTLGDLIKNVASKYGKEARDYLYHESKSGKVDPSIYFLINGANSRTLSGLDTELKDGDIVAIIPPIGGGS